MYTREQQWNDINGMIYEFERRGANGEVDFREQHVERLLNDLEGIVVDGNGTVGDAVKIVHAIGKEWLEIVTGWLDAIEDKSLGLGDYPFTSKDLRRMEEDVREVTSNIVTLIQRNL